MIKEFVIFSFLFASLFGSIEKEELTMQFEENIKKALLISEEEIAQKVAEVAEDLNEQFAGKKLVVIGVLKGSICFVADLIRHLEFPFQLEFVSASSYGMLGAKPGGLKLTSFDALDLKDKDVLLVDDIYDSGKTLSGVFHKIQKKEPKSLHTLVLLRKRVEQKGDIVPDRVCFDIEDAFVIGYGLDYKENFRGLKGIYQKQ